MLGRVRAKTALVIFGTLLVGIVIGSLGTSRVLHNRVEGLYRMRTPEGVRKTIEEVVQPESEAQRQQIRAILVETGELLDSLSRASRARRTTVFDSMHTALLDVLNPEQEQRLAEWHASQRRGSDRRGGSRGHDGERGRDGERERNAPPPVEPPR